METQNPYETPNANQQPPPKPINRLLRGLLMATLILLAGPSALIAGGVICLVAQGIAPANHPYGVIVGVLGFGLSCLVMMLVVAGFIYVLIKIQAKPIQPPPSVKSALPNDKQL